MQTVCFCFFFFNIELDLVDLILKELTSTHTRLQVLKELKKQGLINSASDIKKKRVR